MLNVTYTDPIGHYTLNERGNQYKIAICHANCICAMVYFYTDESGTDMVQLQGWFADLVHAKNCIKTGFFNDCTDITFYAKEMGKDMWNVVKAMTKQGIKVTIE